MEGRKSSGTGGKTSVERLLDRVGGRSIFKMRVLSRKFAVVNRSKRAWTFTFAAVSHEKHLTENI